MEDKKKILRLTQKIKVLHVMTANMMNLKAGLRRLKKTSKLGLKNKAYILDNNIINKNRKKLNFFLFCILLTFKII